MRTGALVFTINNSNIPKKWDLMYTLAMCFSPDGKYLVIGEQDGLIAVRIRTCRDWHLGILIYTPLTRLDIGYHP